MFTIKVNADKIKLRFDHLPVALKEELGRESSGLEKQLLARAIAKASGDVLQIKSGKYAASIKGSVKVNEKSVVAKVYSRDPRAGIFEYGGHTKPHLIQAKNGKALAFLTSGGEIYAAVVHHPGSKIAKHSVINSSFEEMQSQIVNGLKLAGLGIIQAD
jgi:hypothetical protein